MPWVMFCQIAGVTPSTAMLETASSNGRRRPYLATRVRVRFDARPDSIYSVCGSPAAMVRELVRFAELGTDEFVAVFDAVLAGDIENTSERFAREIVQPFLEASAATSA